VEKLKSLNIQAYNNNNKDFIVNPKSGFLVIELVNELYEDPKREGIPMICKKGSCRSCVVKILMNDDLLAPPNKAESLSLSVGKTTIDTGYRLACLAKFV
jgi:ferredoxin